MIYNVKAGILGLDELGIAYASLLKDHVKNLNLIAACGRTQREMLYAKNDLSLEYVYSDEKSLFENHDIDVIFIFSDVQFRAHHAIQAIEAGKHVFLLNPMALNYEDAIAISKAANSKPSQVVMVSSAVRHFPLLELLKNKIKEGIIGKINHMTIESTFVSSLNKRLSKPCGSIFLESSLDEIDLGVWLFEGKFERVLVNNSSHLIFCQAYTDDNMQLNLIVHPKIKKANSFINIYGESGQIIVSNSNNKSFKLINENGDKEEITLEEESYFAFSEYLELHEFTERILGKRRGVLKLNDALESMSLALAFEKSKVLERQIKLED